MRRLVAATALACSAVLGAAAQAQAQAPCDSYSEACPKPSDEVKPTTQVKGVKKTLPFTGAEVTLFALTGAGALAAGSVLVVAGRRRARALA